MKQERNQNSYLISCVCSIVLLLTLCYFGINTDLKGTAAVSTDSCPNGFRDEIIEYNGITYCGNSLFKEGEDGWICTYTSTTIESGYTCNSTGRYNEDGEIIYECTSKDLSLCTVTLSTSTEIPTTESHCQGGLTYDGIEKTLTKPAGAGYTFSNDTRINAGTQEVTATLKNGYVWSDGSTGEKKFSCSIAKATPTITVSKSSLSVEEGSTGTFTVSGTVVGDFTITSSVSGKVTVSNPSYSDVTANTSQTVTVTGVSSGSSTITVSFTPNDTTNYNNASSKTVTVTVTESDEKVDIPTAANKCIIGLKYTGSIQTLTKNAEDGYTFSDNTRTNAGTQEVTAKLKNGYVWSDGSTGEKKFSCSIAKATPTITVSKSSLSVEEGSTNTFTIRGNVVGDFSVTSGTTSVAAVNKSSYNDVVQNSAQTVTVTGVSSGSSTITISFTPNDTTNYNNASSRTVSVTVTESDEKATIPTETYCKTGLVYNGSSQILTKTAGNGYTFSNNTRTNAGTQEVTATLKSGYVWSDGSTGVKKFSCSIAKATPNLSISQDEITLINEGSMSTPQYEYNGDGNLSCSSNSIASCELLQDSKLSITPNSVGSTEIVLTANEGTNYVAASRKIFVTVTAGIEDELPKEETFTVTLDANGGTLSGNDNKKSCKTTSEQCEITELPTAIREGYIFTGWGTDKTCTLGSKDKITLKSDMIYYACWDEVVDKPNTDEDGNLSDGDNPSTGDIFIALIWFFGLFAVGYASYYFNSIKEK